MQDDIKKIIAYSSISHLGYVMLGLLSLELVGIQGAIIQMVSHGLVAAGLFLMVGMIYERCHTRELAAYGGLAKLLPVYSVFFMILTLASVGLPTTSGFTGEFLVLLGAFTAAWPLHLDGNNLPLVLAVGGRDGRGAGRAVHAAFRAHVPVRRGQGASPVAGTSVARPVAAREDAFWALIVVAVFALGLFPDGALQQDRIGRQDVSAVGDDVADGDGRLGGGDAVNAALTSSVNAQDALMAMLPEHLAALAASCW